MRLGKVLGVLAGVMMILSSAAHSVLGWRALRGQLSAAHVAPDLVTGLEIGWQFGGVAMLAFGLIVVALFARPARLGPPPVLPAAIIAAAYLGFGAWGLVVSKLDPFFSVFLVPGLLLAVACALARGRG